MVFIVLCSISPISIAVIFSGPPFFLALQGQKQSVKVNVKIYFNSYPFRTWIQQKGLMRVLNFLHYIFKTLGIMYTCLLQYVTHQYLMSRRSEEVVLTKSSISVAFFFRFLFFVYPIMPLFFFKMYAFILALWAFFFVSSDLVILVELVFFNVSIGFVVDNLAVS